MITALLPLFALIAGVMPIAPSQLLDPTNLAQASSLDGGDPDGSSTNADLGVAADARSEKRQKLGKRQRGAGVMSVRDRVAAIESMLLDIQEDPANAMLFESNENVLRIVQATFSRARKSVHDAIAVLEHGGSVDEGMTDTFHNYLQEFLTNIVEMPPGFIFGTTRAPDNRTKKKLTKAVLDVIDYANKTPGFEDVAHCSVGPESSAESAVLCARRHLEQVYVLLDNRTLSGVTGPGTRASQDLRHALNALVEAVDALVDSGGRRVVQVDADGEPLADSLEPVRSALKEAAIQAEFYRRNYLPNAWRDAHRKRAERIEGLLSPSGFWKKFMGVKELQVNQIQ